MASAAAPVAVSDEELVDSLLAQAMTTHHVVWTSCRAIFTEMNARMKEHLQTFGNDIKKNNAVMRQAAAVAAAAAAAEADANANVPASSFASSSSSAGIAEFPYLPPSSSLPVPFPCGDADRANKIVESLAAFYHAAKQGLLVAK